VPVRIRQKIASKVAVARRAAAKRRLLGKGPKKRKRTPAGTLEVPARKPTDGRCSKCRMPNIP